MREETEVVPDPRTAELAVLLVGAPRTMHEGPDGKIRYAGTDVVVPGAVLVPLSDTVDVREVRTKSGELVAVQVSEATVRESEALAWVPAVGRLLRPVGTSGGGVYEMAAGIWEEHASASVSFRAPEHEAGIGGLMAIEEREVRVARRIAELRAERRSRLVMVASAMGMSQKVVSDLVGLTPGRVHQLIEEAPEPAKVEVADLLADAVEVLQDLARRTVPRELISLPGDRGPEFLEELIAFGLVEEVAAGVRRTERGDDVELHLRATRKRGKRRRSA